jgi:CheY-like chemotaxis protein
MIETILLVEDSEDDVFFMQRAIRLSEVKISLQIVRDGQAAVDYLSGLREYADRRTYPLPSLVLLDLKLPKMLGLDVLRWIRSQPELQTTPVVVLTSSGERSDLERGYRLGANSFMVKPSNADDLLGLAKCLSDYWFKYNILPRQA